MRTWTTPGPQESDQDDDPSTRVVLSLVLTVVALWFCSSACGAEGNSKRNGASVPTPDIVSLLPAGADVLSSDYVQMISGGVPVFAVLFAIHPRSYACPSAIRDPEYLDLFAFDATSQAWAALLDSTKWPGPASPLTPEPDPTTCLPLSRLKMAAVTMRPGVEDIVLNVTLLRKGVYDSRLYIIGLANGKPAVIFETDQQNSMDQDFDVIGDKISYRVAVKTVFDLRSTYSAIDEMVIGFDPSSGKLTPVARRLLPFCVSGSIEATGDFGAAPGPPAGSDTLSTIRLNCINTRGSSIYSVARGTSIGGGSLDELKAGQHVEVTSYRLTNGELVADEIQIIP